MNRRSALVLVRGARLLAGPIALAAFFADWVDGSGLLVGYRFSGFELVALTGNLQHLDLTLPESVGLLLVRLAVLGVAVAASWQLMLALTGARALAYAASGWYLTVASLLVTIAATYQGGLPPPAGPGLLVGAALCFLFGSREVRPRKDLAPAGGHA